MKKVTITLAFEDEKLDALEFSLKKENASVQIRMDDALLKLYEKSVPEPVREYLDSRAAPTVKDKPRRPARPAAPRQQAVETKPVLTAPATAKEVGKNG